MAISAQVRPPLGLPRGSVRALLTLMIVAVVCVEVGRGREFEILWVETLMIALAHYFTSRRFIHLPPEVVRRLEEEGHLEQESNPLYLPRHSIRAIIILSFIGLAVYLYQEGRLLAPQAISILGTVSAYLVGVVARYLLAWWNRGRPARSAWWWDDAKAGVVLVVLLATTTAYLLDRPDLVPRQMRGFTLGLVLFYFGSR